MSRESVMEMFSKAELEYLANPQRFNNGYDRVLAHRIKRKLRDFESQVLPALMQNETTSTWLRQLVTKSCYSVTETRNNNRENTAQLKSLNQAPFPKNNSNFWWAGPDLNRRPAPREGTVLRPLLRLTS